MGDACLEEWARYVREEELLSVLTCEELVLTPEPQDRIILAKIKRMSPDELKEFQKYNPVSLKDYDYLQIQWINTAKYFLGIRLNRPPSEQEAAEEYVERNSLRFMAFYAMKYSGKVERIGVR